MDRRGSFAQLAVFFWLASVLGCASWTPPEEPPSLPSPHVSPDSVILEIQLVDFRNPAEGDFQTLWSAVDEHCIASDVRHQLAENGLRCGILDGQVPQFLRSAIEASHRASEATPGTLPSESGSSYRQLACRAGRRYEIAATEVAEERIEMFKDSGKVRAMKFSDCQGLFSLVATPSGTGEVAVALTPLVRHGAVRSRFKPGPANFVNVPAQDESELLFLQVNGQLRPGATLIVGAAMNQKGIGSWYFRDGEAGQKLLLIRLMQTQQDNLFSVGGSEAPLATPLE